MKIQIAFPPHSSSSPRPPEMFIKSGLPFEFTTFWVPRNGPYCPGFNRNTRALSPFFAPSEWNSPEPLSGRSGLNQMQIAGILSRAYFSRPWIMQCTRVLAHFFGPFVVGSYRGHHQNRLKLICNLRRVWPARYISSDWPNEEEGREGGFIPLSCLLPSSHPCLAGARSGKLKYVSDA